MYAQVTQLMEKYDLRIISNCAAFNQPRPPWINRGDVGSVSSIYLNLTTFKLTFEFDQLPQLTVKSKYYIYSILRELISRVFSCNLKIFWDIISHNCFGTL